MMYKYIVTHPGQTHRDDVLSVALALAIHGQMPCHRRDATPEELQDASVLVLDVGGEYTPELSNFDHHQRGRDESPECALSLYVRAEGKLEAFQLQQWWQPTVLMDVKGPFATAKELGLASFPFGLLSPVEKAILDLFEAETDHVSESLLQLLGGLGRQILDSVMEFKGLFDHTLGRVKSVDIKGVQALVVEDDNTRTLQQVRDRHFPTAGLCLSWDDRGDGWTVYRFNDCPQVDLAVLDGDEAILFAHKGGFIAKTRERLGLDEVLTLVGRAVQ